MKTSLAAPSAIVAGGLLFSWLWFFHSSCFSQTSKHEPVRTPRVQMAILLDTSNSMDGLINQARAQLWAIVNEFTKTKLGGKMPTVEVALYEYGNDRLPPQEGFVRLVVPLTSDLDKVSEALFALTTDGGQEFCGRVIDCAVRQLTWGDAKEDLKCIFIAGNEPFTQGDVDYQKACQAAAAQGITVSTIFCGSHEEGIRTEWQRAAQLADGSYLSIDQDQAVSTLSAPQDQELARLGAELSKTYIPYGAAEKRAEHAGRQVAQDANAAKAAVAAAASRAAFKASGLYRNADWDLVDAVQQGHVRLEALPADQLPEPLQGMTVAGRKAYVEQMAQQRRQIQERVKSLSAARNLYLAEQQQRLAREAAASARPGAPAPAPAASFERAVIDAVRRQVEGK